MATSVAPPKPVRCHDNSSSISVRRRTGRLRSPRPRRRANPFISRATDHQPDNHSVHHYSHWGNARHARQPRLGGHQHRWKAQRARVEYRGAIGRFHAELSQICAPPTDPAKCEFTTMTWLSTSGPDVRLAPRLDRGTAGPPRCIGSTRIGSTSSSIRIPIVATPSVFSVNPRGVQRTYSTPTTAMRI